MKYKGKLLAIGLLTGILLVGCSQKGSLSSTDPVQTDKPSVTEPVQTENAANEPKKYDPEKQEGEPLSYTDEQKTEILEAAKKAGLEKVYVPTIGLGVDDYLDRVEVGENEVRIVFIRGSITQSSKELKPLHEIETTREVQLADNITGKWIKEKDGVEFLYFEIEGTYFSIKSAKDFYPAAYEKAAGSVKVLD